MKAVTSIVLFRIALIVFLTCCWLKFTAEAFQQKRCATTRPSVGLFIATTSPGATEKEPGRVGRFLNRFRKKQKLIQDEIEVGASLPDIDVQMATSPIDITANDSLDVININELFGSSSSTKSDDESEETKPKSSKTQILVGMPGAYTPTCTNVHLPGFVNSLSKLQSLGVDTIGIITTNDRFVNNAWAQDLGISLTAKTERERVVVKSEAGEDVNNDDNEDENNNSIVMLSDGDGELVRSIGLAEDMGFGVGIISKRFALILQDGIIANVLTDDGMEDCANTTAERLIEILTPSPAVSSSSSTNDGNHFNFDELPEQTKQGLLVAGGIALALMYSWPHH